MTKKNFANDYSLNQGSIIISAGMKWLGVIKDIAFNGFYCCLTVMHYQHTDC